MRVAWKIQHSHCILFLVLFFTSCIPPVQGPPPDPRSFDEPDTDLLDLGGTLPYFEDFMYALEKTHLTHLMEEEGPYTVFAPVQASFSIFRAENMIKHLDDFPSDKLADILRYHFIQGEWTLANIPSGYHATLLPEKSSGNPIDIYIEKSDVFRINGLNTIDEPDLATANGYIQSIKTILKIPSLIDHLSINKDFSLILEILERSDLDPDLMDHLSNADPITFFVPKNEAILSYLGAHPLWETIHDIPSGTLNDILRNHMIFNHNIVLNDVKKDRILRPESGQEFTIHIDYPEWSVLGKSGKVANLSIRDIQAANGIIHQIDRVLIN
jgi:transforming growth factor-beta-induced protein